MGEHIRKPIIRKLLLQRGNHLLPGLGLLIPRLILITLFLAGIPAHGTDIDHAIAELDECTAHGGQTFDVGDVFQTEPGEFLVFLLADPADEGL